MSVVLNAKGTSVPYFAIGKNGITIYQGGSNPANTYTVKAGDYWLDTSTNSIKVRSSVSTWVAPSLSNLDFTTNTVSVSGVSADIPLNLSSKGAESVFLNTNGSARLQATSAGNIIVGSGALATSATDGFLYVTGAPGVPNGTPTSFTGRSPLVVDTTNGVLYFYTGSSWKSAGGGGSGTVTSVDVSGGTTGLTTSGGPVTSSGTITLAGTLAVANGGTGATTAGTARSNLSAAASGANSDITSISGLTTALTVAQGGTGATTANTAFNNLVPSQVTNNGKFLTTDGTNTSWSSVPASSLSGTTLASGVTASSLTSVGTLSALAVTGTTTQSGALNLAGASSPLQVGGSAGTSGQVLTSAGTGVTPTWSSTPTLTGTNFTGIPNGALTNSSITIGSTSVSLGATATTLAGLTSVSATTFTGALTGNASTATSATTATNIDGGAAGNVPYQSAAGTTAFVTNAAGVLQAATSGATPAWTTTPTLTGTNFSSIPNGALTNSSITVGSTSISLGATATTLAGLTSVTATTFTGALTGNASTATALQTSRSISATGDAAWTVNFNGSANATADITLATVNASPQTDTFRKITVNGKGLVTATSAVSSSDITTALGFTPVNKAGDTMTGALILSGDPTNDLGAATKQYVDATASGLNVHAACVTATTATGNLTAATYSNGTGGVGATLTATANGSINSINAGAGVGGYNTLIVGNRLLVKNQSSQIQNGIYTVSVIGTGSVPWVLTRATDFDGSPTSEVVAGDLTYIQQGTLIGTQWVQTNVGTGVSTSPAYNYVIIGTDNLTFEQFSGANTYTAGTGIQIASNVISNTGVLSNVAGTGISVSGATGSVTITNAGVTSAIAGTNISVSAGTGAVTISVTGTVPTATTATNIAAGSTGNVPYQSAAGTTAFVTNGAGILQAATSGATPAWTTTPTLTGTNFSSIPNSALTNSSVTVNGTAISLGASGTVTAAAGTLTGATLASGVTASSLTSVGTLTAVSTSGTVTVNGIGVISTSTLTTSATTANQVVDSIAIATYRAASYKITVSSGSAYQYTEVTLMHNGVDVYVSEINTILSGSSLATFTADISGGNMRLLTTPVNAVTAYKTVSTLITV
jgi:hypothetical protein